MTPRERLIESHLPLVQSVARRYAASDEPFEDLVQVGTIGLIKAVDRYDAGRGVALGAYATPSIDGEIRHHLRDRSAPVRVPRRLQADGVRVTAVELGDAAEHAADPVAEAQERMELGAALRCLPARERRLLLLRFVGDLSQAQIADRTGLSPVNVSRTLKGALSRLRDYFEDGQKPAVAEEASRA